MFAACHTHSYRPQPYHSATPSPPYKGNAQIPNQICRREKSLPPHFIKWPRLRNLYKPQISLKKSLSFKIKLFLNCSFWIGHIFFHVFCMQDTYECILFQDVRRFPFHKPSFKLTHFLHKTKKVPLHNKTVVCSYVYNLVKEGKQSKYQVPSEKSKTATYSQNDLIRKSVWTARIL